MYILKLYILIATICLVFPTVASAELITYELKGVNSEFAFNGFFSSFTDSSGGEADGLQISLIESVQGSTDGLTSGVIKSDANSLGVDTGGSETENTQLDGTNGNESIEFIFSPPPSTDMTVELKTIEVFSFDGTDSGTLTIDGNTTGIASGSNTVIPVHTNLADSSFSIAYTAGDGFGLVSITLDVTAVPEPGTTALLGVLAVAGLCTRRRPPGLV